MLTYNDQAFSRALRRKGIIRPSQLGIDIHTTQDHVQQVRIVPRQGYYVVEIVYERAIDPQPVDYTAIAGIDLGIDNVITRTSNQSEITPLAMNGRVIKSINQFYNKERARLQSYLGNRTSHRIHAFTAKRNRTIKHMLHVISRRVIDHLVAHGIGTLVIGYNEGWKQTVNLGRRTHQQFVQIPFMQLVHMLTYKAQLLGLQVVLQEESYTSKCSFFDGEPIKKQMRYLGRRIKRGLFRTSDGLIVNADVNGSYNIITKAFPSAFDAAGPLQIHPTRITLTSSWITG
jgi:putative transposase